MTMRLTITNEDVQRVATVTVENYAIGVKEPVRVDSADLEPGISREVWIHASRRVVVTENADAIRPAKP